MRMLVRCIVLCVFSGLFIGCAYRPSIANSGGNCDILAGKIMNWNAYSGPVDSALLELKTDLVNCGNQVSNTYGRGDMFNDY